MRATRCVFNMEMSMLLGRPAGGGDHRSSSHLDFSGAVSCEQAAKMNSFFFDTLFVKLSSLLSLCLFLQDDRTGAEENVSVPPLIAAADVLRLSH